jgi:hypothetical protein
MPTLRIRFIGEPAIAPHLAGGERRGKGAVSRAGERDAVSPGTAEYAKEVDELEIDAASTDILANKFAAYNCWWKMAASGPAFAESIAPAT